MAYELFIGDKARVEDRLNGGAQLGPFPSNGLPIGGLTLIFISPSATTVTFTGAVGEMRTWAQILDDLATQIAAVTSKIRPVNNGPSYSGGTPAGQVQLVLNEDGGIQIDKDGTANEVLKIPTAADTTYPGLVGQTEIVGFTQGSTPAHYAVLINTDPTP